MTRRSPTTDSSDLANSRRMGDAPRPMAVIDIGTTSIRLAVAEVDRSDHVRMLETFSQAVHLGRDTFTRGYIEKGTIEECVRVLKAYRQVLREFQIDRSEQIRVVATSAVREASNRVAFLDRIYSATEISVEALDESEVSRITYLGVQPLIQEDPQLSSARTLVTEVGGGSTEVLLVQNSDVLFSHTYRLGSLRLRETLKLGRASQSAARSLIEAQIKRSIAQILQQVPAEAVHAMVGLGGDLRFAVQQLRPEERNEGLVRLSVEELSNLADLVLLHNEDKLVHKYHIAYPDAGTLGPSLMAFVQLAKGFQLDEIIASRVNLRDGLLSEMTSHESWTDEFQNQVMRSAEEIGRKFDIDQDHAKHVAKLSKILFQGLREEHKLPAKFELLTRVAAYLHEVGMYIGVGAYHKHTMYLIQNSELFGMSRSDMNLIALAARYHRRASPKPTHTYFMSLPREQRIAVKKMAAILRVADALDAAHSRRLHELRFSRESGRLVISVPLVDDLSVEELAIRQTGTLFEETFGVPVLLRKIIAQ